MKLDSSRAVFEAARALIPGGVNSPVRAHRTVGGIPPHIARGEGAYVTDLDGNRYVDLVLAYGPLILGHAHPRVTSALQEASAAGTAFGAPSEPELELARAICERMPHVEMVRLVNSGTEATMSALRLARAVTGREGMIKFNGCYHGHGDSFLVKAGSGALTLGAPDSPGVPQALAELTLVAEYNDLDSVRRLFDEQATNIACVFVEPVAGNMGCVLPEPGFLAGLRELCDRHSALLIFDEVMTGFRVARGGYQELCAVRPDLVTLGKVIGGGLPVGAYGGRAELMREISPEGSVYQAGTLSGNPLAVAAGLVTLDELDGCDAYPALEAAGRRLEEGLLRLALERDLRISVGRQGSMLCPYFSGTAVRSFGDASGADHECWKKFFRGMLEHGIHLPPSPHEAWFLSTAHNESVIDEILAAARESFARCG